MSKSNRLLSLSEMRDFLAEIDEILSGQLPPATIYTLYTIGGIAMAASDDKRLTVDIDVVTEHIPEAVIDAAHKVAVRHGLNDNWINNEVAKMVNADLPPSYFEEVYRGNHLAIYGAKPDCLLALKLMSGRGKDLDDIIELTLALGVATSAEMIEVCDSVFTHTSAWHIQREFVEEVCQDVVPLIRKRLAGRSISRELGLLKARYDGENDVQHYSVTKDPTWREKRQQRRARLRVKRKNPK